MVGIPLLLGRWATRSTASATRPRSCTTTTRSGCASGARATCSRCGCRSSRATTWTSTGAATSSSSGSASYKRNLILPQTLKRMVVREANFAGDHLEITFGRPPRPSRGSRRPRMTGERGRRSALDVGGTKTAAIRVTSRARCSPARSCPRPRTTCRRRSTTMVEVGTRGDRDRRSRAIGVGAAGLVEKDTGRLSVRPEPRLAEHPARPARVGRARPADAGRQRRATPPRGASTGSARGRGLPTPAVRGGRDRHRRRHRHRRRSCSRGAHGFAAEIGHIIVDPDGPLCGCGNHGCWEQVASGHAITRAGREAAAAAPAVDDRAALRRRSRPG